MSERALDFSNARYDPHALKAAGVTTVFRYVALPSWPKALTAAEAKGYLDVGISVALNFETAATRALDGADAGRVDAVNANKWADDIGCPRDVVIFYSVDAGLSYQQVAPYFLGAKSAGGRPVGIYGPLTTGLALQASGVTVATWVTNAASWSGYRSWDALATAARASNAVALQHLDHPLAGLDPHGYDYDEILRPFTRWGAAPPAQKVTAQYVPAITLPPIVSSLAAPKGAWLLGEDGGVFAFGGAPFYGAPHGQSYWGTRTAATITSDDKGGYIVTATSGETYKYGP